MVSSAYTEKLVEHDGYTTHYLEGTGAGPNAPTVMLVHDGWFGADAATLWSRVIGELAGSFRVIAPDMLGFGGTDKLVYFDRSMYFYRAAHLGSFVRAVCGDGVRVHAVGTSMGGSVLVRDVAADFPQIPVSSVVSISGSGGPWRSAFGAAELGRFDGTSEDIARVLAHMADDFEDYARVLAARYENSEIAGHAECLLSAKVKHPTRTRQAPGGNWPAALASVTVPVTFVGGRRDPLLEEGWEQQLAGVGDSVEVLALDAKHAPSLDQPAVVASLISDAATRAGRLARHTPAEEAL